MANVLATPENLNSLVEFDCPFQVNPDGTILQHGTGYYAPELLDEKLYDSAWRFVNGYSGQDRYAGPIMHNSEYLGGAMARDVLSEPGIYCLVAAYWSTIEDDPAGVVQDTIEGWALVKHQETED